MGLKKIVKGGLLGGALMGGAGALTGGILGGAGANVKDFLLGKKSGGFSADEIAGEIRRVQGKGILSAEQGLERINKELEKSGEGVAREQVARQQKGLVTAAQDARRRAQEMIARRGLQNSSIGLAGDRSINKDLGEQTAALQASLPGLIRAQNLQDASTLQQAGLNTFGGLGGSAGVRFQGQEGTRSGGALGIASSLAPLAGSIGGIMTGAANLKRANMQTSET